MSFFNSKVFTVKRYPPVSIVNGVFQNATPNNLSITGTAQPATAEQIALLPEGRRVNGVMVVFTSTMLQTAEENSHNADIVVINGLDYEVVLVKKWDNGLIMHYETSCVLVDSHL